MNSIQGPCKREYLAAPSPRPPRTTRIYSNENCQHASEPTQAGCRIMLLESQNRLREIVSEYWSTALQAQLLATASGTTD
jgi:hypothetical protein